MTAEEFGKIIARHSMLRQGKLMAKSLPCCNLWSQCLNWGSLMYLTCDGERQQRPSARRGNEAEGGYGIMSP